MSDNKPIQDELQNELEQLRRENARLKAQVREVPEFESVFKGFVDTSRDAFFYVAPTGATVYASPACEIIFGYAPDEFLEDPELVGKILHPGYRKQFEKFWSDFLESGNLTSGTMEWGWVHRDGRMVFTENVFSKITGPDGTATGFVTIARDISKRKTTEKALLESEDRYRILFESSPEIVAIVSLDGLFLDVNKIPDIFPGLEREDLIGSHFAELNLLDEEDLPRYIDMFIEMARGRRMGVLEVDVNIGDGKKACIEVYISRLMKDDELFAYQVIARDITDRKKAEEALQRAHDELEIRVKERTAELNEAKDQLEHEIEEQRKTEKALRESEDRYRRLFNSAPQAISILGADGLLKEANPAHEFLTGYSRDDVVGRHLSELPYYVSDKHTQFVHKFEAFKDVDIQEVLETEIDRKDGDRIAVEVHFSRLLKDDEFSGYQIIALDITERKRTQEALRESEEKYRRIVENLQHEYFFYSHGKDGIVNYISQSITQVLGYTQKQFMKHYSRYMTENPLNEKVFINKRYASIGRKQPPYEMEIYHKNGSSHWLEIAEFPVFDTDGEVLAIDGIAHDITGQKMALKALRDSEDRFRRLSENSQDIIGRWTPTNGIEYVNPAIENILGYSPEYITGQHGFLMTNIHEDDSQRIIDSMGQMGQVANSAVRLEFRVSSKSGDYVWIEMQPVPIFSDGLLVALEFIGRDITARKKAEELIAREKRTLENVIDLNPYAIQLLDRDGMVARCNQALVNLFGAEPPSDYCVFDDPIIKEQGIMKYFERVLEGEVVETPEVEYNIGIIDPGKFSDKPVVVRSVLFPIVNPNGEIENIVIMHEDVTKARHMEQERETLQQQLLQSQKMEAVGTLAGGMAHEFNNILSVVLGTAEMTLKKMDEQDPNHKRVMRILKSAERARVLTTQLLTFARKEKMEITSFSVNELIFDMQDILQRSISSKLEMKIEESPEPLYVEGDVNQLQQSLLNLCINAIDAMPGGGVLTITSSRVDLDENYCRQYADMKPGPYALVDVLDSGQGITEENQKKIFEPFFTTKDKGKGTGLGLSITMGIIQKHGGHMKVESTPGKGTRVSMVLPLSEANPAAAAEEMVRDIRGNGELILVVDDNKALLDVSRETLEDAGFRTILTSSGREAIKIFREKKDEIRLMLLDIMMPEMDGREVYIEISEIDPDVRVIVMSAYSEAHQARELKNRGVNHFLQKPFSMRRLIETVDTVIHRT